MAAFVDQTGKTVFLPGIPKRIISLVPSQTELLAALGLDEEVVGITKFCIHPSAWFHSKKRIGGTKQLHYEDIHQLQPDLIIANKEENIKEQVEYLAGSYPVWVSDVETLEDAYDMITGIGDITEKKIQAAALVAGIKTAFGSLIHAQPPQRMAYLIWKAPYMTVGHDTFIHSMLAAAGYENVFAARKRYPAITIEELRSAACDLVFLSSEPFPFGQKHIDELAPLLPETRIILVDGEMFSWYGSRLLHAPDYFRWLSGAISSEGSDR